MAVLFLTHHDQATAGLVKGQVGLGVKLSPDEVRMHKKAWEEMVAAELKISKKSMPDTKRRQFVRLFEFEGVQATRYVSPQDAY